MKYQNLKDRGLISFYDQPSTDNLIEQLPSGIYKIVTIPMGFMMAAPAFEPVMAKEKLVDLNDGVLKDFLSEVKRFFSEKTKAAFTEMRITHKTGFIIYGTHGTGKTSLCNLAMQHLCKDYGAVCLLGGNVGIKVAKQVINQIRKNQDSPIVLFIDECDSPLSCHEHEYLEFLDGNESVDGFIFLGCTNHMEDIPPRIKNRKSRIKKCFEITNLPYQVYEQYLREKLPSMDSKIVAEFAHHATEKKISIDQFKNAVLDYKLYGMKITKAIDEALVEYD